MEWQLYTISNSVKGSAGRPGEQLGQGAGWRFSN